MGCEDSREVNVVPLINSTNALSNQVYLTFYKLVSFFFSKRFLKRLVRNFYSIWLALQLCYSKDSSRYSLCSRLDETVIINFLTNFPWIKLSFLKIPNQFNNEGNIVSLKKEKVPPTAYSNTKQYSNRDQLSKAYLPISSQISVNESRSNLLKNLDSTVSRVERDLERSSFFLCWRFVRLGLIVEYSYHGGTIRRATKHLRSNNKDLESKGRR